MHDEDRRDGARNLEHTVPLVGRELEGAGMEHRLDEFA